MKRIACILISLLAILLVACAANQPSPAAVRTAEVTREKAQQVKMGMSLDQVENLLGSGVDIASGSVIHRYELDDGDVAIFSYTIGSEGIYRVSHIYIGEPSAIGDE